MSNANQTPLTGLTAFQRDLLRAIAKTGKSSGQDVKSALEEAYGSDVQHGRLYPNLDTVVEMGLVKKGTFDRRTNSYEISEKGIEQLKAHNEWQAEAL